MPVDRIAFRHSIRTRMALAMVLVVVSVSGGILWQLQRIISHSYTEIHQDQFQEQMDLFYTAQRIRLEAVEAALDDITGNVRLLAALQAGDSERFYSDLAFDLTGLIFRSTIEALGSAKPFFRVISAEEGYLPLNQPVVGTLDWLDEAEFEELLGPLALVDESDQRTRSGYLNIHSRDISQLFEVFIHSIEDPFDDWKLGELIVGIPVKWEAVTGRGVYSGLMIENDWLLPPGVGRNLLPDLAGEIPQRLEIEGQSYLVFEQSLAQPAGFPIALRLTFFSLDRLYEVINEFVLVTTILAVFALVVGLLASGWFAQRLTAPIFQLVKVTREVQSGNYQIKLPQSSPDELGLLSRNFNQMTEGLALKEKFRAVLDKVADPDVANELVKGELQLGGEERQVSILFCDIRGFTQITDGMSPRRVIAMLNEHMTLLTDVVRKYNGVVDKFVGDEIMVLFGAPLERDDDVKNALDCAIEMIRVRKLQNDHSEISLNIGIGIATGQVIAGCMGSENRLNYTVLGDRVNLASRLCSLAGSMEIIICQETKERIGGSISVDPIDKVSIKGFQRPAPVFKVKLLI